MSEKDEGLVVSRDDTPVTGPRNAKERVYEKLRMPLWVLDTILIVLGVALVVCLVLGAIKGNAGA